MNIFIKKNHKENKFAKFFTESSSKEKVKVLKQVVRQANKDQLDLVERYENKRASEEKLVL